MAPTGTRSAPKRKAATTIAEPAAKKAKTAAAPNTAKKLTARSAILAGAKTNPVMKNSSIAPAKKAALKSTTAASKKAPTKSTATASKKAPTKSTAAATKKAPAKSTATPTKKAPAKSTAAAAKKAATPAKATKATATTSTKRKRDEDEDEEAEQEEEVKKAARPAKKVKAKVVINEVPTQKLDVYVFGEGSSGELGLGTAKNAIDVKRPRLNPLLSAQDVGVVQMATGGMHVVALTRDGRILTWGVNDHGALGRDTTWDGGMKDVADNKSDSDDASDSGLNPRESTPTAIPSGYFPAGTVFVKVAAGDSLSLALTDDGHVYGWGTFRGNDGIVGFSKTSRVQATPVLIPALTKVTDIVCGANHALALDSKGDVYIWGSGEQNQLGYRVVIRTRGDALVPRLLRLRKKIRTVGCGQDHSFAVGKDEHVYAWGLNSFGETAVSDNAGDDGAVVPNPIAVPALNLPNNDKITYITGGAHHSVAITASGRCLIWGRLDGSQTGLDPATLPENDIIKDAKDVPRILIEPTDVPNVIGAIFVAAGTDNTIAIDQDGKAWSWGFSANYQTGLGTDDDVPTPTMIQNTAVRDKALTWAGAGGQYGVLASAHVDEEEVVAGPSGANGR